jgi:hypothetical protein
MRAFRKAIVIVLATLAVTLFLSFIAMDPYYYSARPRQPDPKSGRVYPEKVKGFGGVADVYLTRSEKLPYRYADWILVGYGILFFTAVLLNRRWKVVRNLTLRGWEYPK